MATLTVQDISEAGLAASYDSADVGGDEFANAESDVLLHVVNGDASSITVTITAQNDSTTKPGYGALSKADAGGTVAGSGEKFFGPFPRSAFNDGAGKVQVTYSAVTSVTVAALRLPRVQN